MPRGLVAQDRVRRRCRAVEPWARATPAGRHPASGRARPGRAAHALPHHRRRPPCARSHARLRRPDAPARMASLRLAVGRRQAASAGCVRRRTRLADRGTCCADRPSLPMRPHCERGHGRTTSSQTLRWQDLVPAPAWELVAGCAVSGDVDHHPSAALPPRLSERAEQRVRQSEWAQQVHGDCAFPLFTFGPGEERTSERRRTGARCVVNQTTCPPRLPVILRPPSPRMPSVPHFVGHTLCKG